MPAERNLRIGNCSGATGDAPHAMARMVREADVDVITGDWSVHNLKCISPG